MAAKDLNIQFDEFEVRRIEHASKRLGLDPATFSLFSILKAVDDLEHLEKVMRDPDLREQFKDVVDLRKLGKLTAEDFEREVVELLSMSDDAEWTPNK